MPRGRLVWDNRELAHNLNNMSDRVEEALYEIMRFEAPPTEAYMRNNAPWTDRTGNARSGLTARGFRDGNNFGIDLAHSVSYGIWLEIRFSGRFSIISPTIDSRGPEVMQTVSELFSRL